MNAGAYFADALGEGLFWVGFIRIGDVSLYVTTQTSAVEDMVDAGDVAVGILRLTPDILVPFEFAGAPCDEGELRI